MTRPKGKTDIHVFLDPELADRLRTLAEQNGLSLTAQARMMLMEALRRRPKSKPNYQQERVTHA